MLTTALPVSAQLERSGIIDEARAESDLRLALDYFLAAAEPVGIDSLWAVSVYEIAQILRDLDDEPASDTWLRWAARHGREWPIDPNWFAPSLVAAYRQAEAEVTSEIGSIEDVLGADAAETSWEWPTRFVVGSVGTLVIRPAEASVALSVTLGASAGPVTGGVPVSLVTGTHVASLTAEGYESARLLREVLPGVSTTVTIALAPLLPAVTAEQVGGRLLQLRYFVDGVFGCSNAVSVRDGLALSPLSTIGSATQLDLVSPGRVLQDVEIIESDPALDLAVLRLSGEPLPETFPTAVLPTPYAWSVYRLGCDGPLGTQRWRLPSASVDGGGRLAIGPLSTGSVGSPVIDREGRVIGLVVGDGSVTPLADAMGLIEAAAAGIEDDGFPLAWVTAGVAAAAGAAAYFLRARGGGGSTGGIVIVLPTN